MKYFVAATPGPMPPTPEQFDVAIAWLQAKLDDRTSTASTGSWSAAASASRTPTRTASCST